MSKAGLGICAISYDSREILKGFAERRGITFPLLSDPSSKIIRAFGILNTAIPPDQMAYGIPYPGSFLVDAMGRVLAKFFEEDFRDRYSVGSILVRRFGSPLDTKQTTIAADHVSLKYYASTGVAFPGSRISLIVELRLKDKVHLYAPDVQGYKPVKLILKPSPGMILHPVSYPRSHSLFLPAIKETVPVYEGGIRLIQDVTIPVDPPALSKALNSAGELTIEGSLQFQACDDKMCYLPRTLPLRWVIKVQELDKQRAPESLRRDSQMKNLLPGGISSNEPQDHTEVLREKLTPSRSFFTWVTMRERLSSTVSAEP